MKNRRDAVEPGPINIKLRMDEIKMCKESLPFLHILISSILSLMFIGRDKSGPYGHVVCLVPVFLCLV